MKKIVKYGSLLVMTAVVFAACSQQTTPSTDETTDTTDESMMIQESEQTDAMMDETTDELMTETDAEVDYTVTMSNFKFDVTELEAAPGQTLRVKIVNGEGMHDFVIDELNVQSSVLEEPGTEEIVEVSIPEDATSGTEYEFYCSVMQHRQMGMVGTLTVK